MGGNSFSNVRKDFDKKEIEENYRIVKIRISVFPGKLKYHTGYDLYRWSRGKSRSFLLTIKLFMF
jgi:hypothetical protein